MPINPLFPIDQNHELPDIGLLRMAQVQDEAELIEVCRPSHKHRA